MERSANPLRLAVLVSGGGTTLQNFLDRCADGRLPAQVVLVVASRADAFALERARQAGVNAVAVERKEVRPQFLKERPCLGTHLDFRHIPAGCLVAHFR